MFSSRIRIITGILFLCALQLWANPFVKPREEKVPDPVRPPSFSASSRLIDAQLRFRESMGNFFDRWKEDQSAGALLSLAAAGFLYGVLHALGPGHRKMVMFSLFMARKARFHEPLLAGLLSAFLHGMSAAGIIFIFRSLSNRLLVERVNITTLYLEGFTYLLLVLMAVVLLVLDIRSHSHGHGEGEGKNRSLYGTIAVTSLFPCPAAVMILIFSLTLDLFVLGLVAVAALSLGMGLTISLVGYIAWSGRTSLMNRLAGREKLIGRISHILEGAGYTFLILFSLWMSLPFLVSLPGVIR
ncbi:MAG: hypothetical protein PQJ60_12875 [Spirochaetales bacterium]|nr:hypothetical protein [Spirochaetales bacterium]